MSKDENKSTTKRGGASRCDRCGEVVSDIDAGFSPGLHAMAHDCGGTWRRITDAEVDHRCARCGEVVSDLHDCGGTRQRRLRGQGRREVRP